MRIGVGNENVDEGAAKLVLDDIGLGEDDGNAFARFFEKAQRLEGEPAAQGARDFAENVRIGQRHGHPAVFGDSGDFKEFVKILKKLADPLLGVGVCADGHACSRRLHQFEREVLHAGADLFADDPADMREMLGLLT